MDDERLDLSKNAEIQQALKEFETKAAEEEAKQLPLNKEPEASKLAIWLIKHSGGAIKDERQAEYVLLGFVIIALAFSAYLFFSGGPSEEKIIPPMPVAGPEDPNFIP